MEGQKWFQSGLNRVYLPKQLTDMLLVEGTLLLCGLTQISSKKYCFNHPSVTESPLRERVFCTGAFLYVSYSFCWFLTSLWFKFTAQATALQCGKKIYCDAVRLKKVTQNTETHVHKTTYEPLIDTALYVMLLMLLSSKALRMGPYKSLFIGLWRDVNTLRAELLLCISG